MVRGFTQGLNPLQPNNAMGALVTTDGAGAIALDPSVSSALFAVATIVTAATGAWDLFFVGTGALRQPDALFTVIATGFITGTNVPVLVRRAAVTTDRVSFATRSLAGANVNIGTTALTMELVVCGR